MLFRDQQSTGPQTRRKPNSASNAETRRKSASKPSPHTKTPALGSTAHLHSEKPDVIGDLQMPVVTPTDIFQRLSRLIGAPQTGLGNVWVCGELVNVSPKTRAGHMYFDLKDENGSKLSCTLFGVDRIVPSSVQPLLANGTQILVRGQIRLACKYSGSQYQCNVREVRVHSTEEGLCERQLAEWKDMLHKEGRFDVSRKQPVPRCPRVVAIVTSDGGAALQDVRQTLENANVPFTLRVYPCTVQGENCVPTVIEQLKRVCAHVGDNTPDAPDVVLVTRGGGSKEDLWAFNEPELVRAVDNLRGEGHLPPVICAIGHQVDNPLLERVCDATHITPTYAAQALAEPFVQVRERARVSHDSMRMQTDQALNQTRQRYAHLLTRARQFDVSTQICEALQRKHVQLEKQVGRHLQEQRNRTQQLLRRVVGSSPWCALHQHSNLALLKHENGVDDLDMRTLHAKNPNTRGTMVLSTRDGQVKVHYRVGV